MQRWEMVARTHTLSLSRFLRKPYVTVNKDNVLGKVVAFEPHKLLQVSQDEICLLGIC